MSITRSNYWNEIKLSRMTTIPQSLMQEIFSTTTEKNINKGFISFLCATTNSSEAISLELAQFGMHYFPLLFQSHKGAGLALSLFVQMPLRSFVSSNIEYPKTPPISYGSFIEDEQFNRLMEKIDHLSELGEEFLQAYALLPYFFTKQSLNCRQSRCRTKRYNTTILSTPQEIKPHC